ncbi:Rne/Rng family ribonuclease [Actinotalea sp. K2]|uniref:Rne/Rng family ribonuclease n=1 Tax=Actinotalea sp. K2 TaxID=2939438 RepID=UPI0020174443|nr:Rne/Rng family ribonuclease [Actinotalea sp. K2]MCL3860553.1 Rne/Rng family ribonuclease [Actinotalea sp. K2]
MTIENSPTADTTTPSEGTTRAPRRSRRAASAPAQTISAPATTGAAPVVSEPQAESAPASTPRQDAATEGGEQATPPRAKRTRRAPATAQAEPPAAPDEPRTATQTTADAPPAARRGSGRSRRATSPVTAPEGESAPAGSAPAQQAASEDVAAPTDEAAEPAPTSRAARSRSRKTAAKGTTQAEPTAGTSEVAQGEPADAASSPQEEPAAPQQVESEQAAPRSRSRRTRKPATEKEAPEQEATEPTSEQPSTAAAGSRDVGQTFDVFAALGKERGESTVEPDTSEPRLARTALLFQAPDPESRPKRRRAQAPAGPPRPIEDEAVPVVDDDQDEDETTQGAEQSTAGVPEQREPTDRSAGADEDDEDGAEDDEDGRDGGPRRRRRRGGRGRRSRSGGSADPSDASQDTSTNDTADRATQQDDQSDEGSDEDADSDSDSDSDEGSSSSRRRRRRRRSGRSGDAPEEQAPAANGRGRSRSGRTASDEVTALKGSTRLEAKRQRRREGRDAGRRRSVITESEFLARREAVDRTMVVRESDGRVQIAVLEDNVLVEHFVSRTAQNSQGAMAGNVYLGRVQNVLPSMEAAFVDVGKGRNAVLYAGEVNWDAAGLEGQPRRIEQALKSGDSVLVQVTKDPIGHKGARLTSQVTLAGRYLVYVPGGGMTGISRKLPDTERARLKKILKEVVPDAAGVIVRTAAEGASEEELRNDVQRLQDQWAAIEKKAKTASAPALLQGEPDLAIRVVRDIFNDDFRSLVVQGDDAWTTISAYVDAMAPDLAERVSRWSGSGDVFAEHRIDEQLVKGMDRKVFLPSGGSLVIDRTEAMTVVDVNTGKFTGSGGTLEETVTRNNLEAAEEIVRQLRLRDIGGIIVIDFIDMVLESNRDLVLRRLLECLGRDRTKHQVAEVTSLGLVQMTRKRVGQGLVEAFSETCEHCHGRGFIVHSEPLDSAAAADTGGGEPSSDGATSGESTPRQRRKKATGGGGSTSASQVSVPVLPEAREAVKATLATIAAAAAHAHEHEHEHGGELSAEGAQALAEAIVQRATGHASTGESTPQTSSDTESRQAEADAEVPVGQDAEG